MVAIIDYDAGNLNSVKKALEYIGAKVCVTRDEKTILSAEHVVLPGVGAFGVAMEQLVKYGLDEVARQVAQKGIPLLGICLGLQLLFGSSEESEGVAGLSLLDGEVLRIPEAQGLKIPHIGWNSLELSGDGRLFRGIEDGAYVYFVHSYYLRAREESIVKASTEYGCRIHASVERDNVFACQFHPEKSGEVGLKILENFLKV